MLNASKGIKKSKHMVLICIKPPCKYSYGCHNIGNYYFQENREPKIVALISNSKCTNEN
jgi:hypothetical protein